ncbi:hypothetical protein C5E44_13670 [Nocardia nova]|nr:hypothetical protein C5E44_13670 [Nocardia nova]
MECARAAFEVSAERSGVHGRRGTAGTQVVTLEFGQAAAGESTEDIAVHGFSSEVKPGCGQPAAPRNPAPATPTRWIGGEFRRTGSEPGTIRFANSDTDYLRMASPLTSSLPGRTRTSLFW